MQSGYTKGDAADEHSMRPISPTATPGSDPAHRDMPQSINKEEWPLPASMLLHQLTSVAAVVFPGLHGLTRPVDMQLESLEGSSPPSSDHHWLVGIHSSSQPPDGCAGRRPSRSGAFVSLVSVSMPPSRRETVGTRVECSERDRLCWGGGAYRYRFMRIRIGYLSL